MDAFLFDRKDELSEDDIGEHQEYKALLWTAPELLRMKKDERPYYGTQRGDIYSFGIILQEILYRALPYFLDTLTPKGKWHIGCTLHSTVLACE